MECNLAGFPKEGRGYFSDQAGIALETDEDLATADWKTESLMFTQWELERPSGRAAERPSEDLASDRESDFDRHQSDSNNIPPLIVGSAAKSRAGGLKDRERHQVLRGNKQRREGLISSPASTRGNSAAPGTSPGSGPETRRGRLQADGARHRGADSSRPGSRTGSGIEGTPEPAPQSARKGQRSPAPSPGRQPLSPVRSPSLRHLPPHKRGSGRRGYQQPAGGSARSRSPPHGGQHSGTPTAPQTRTQSEQPRSPPPRPRGRRQLQSPQSRMREVDSPERRPRGRAEEPHSSGRPPRSRDTTPPEQPRCDVPRAPLPEDRSPRGLSRSPEAVVEGGVGPSGWLCQPRA